MRLPLYSLLLLALAAGSARAQFPCEVAYNSYAQSPAGHIMVVPDGSGATLASAGLTVELWVEHCVGEPVPGYSRLDMWLHGEQPADLSVCYRGSIADADTDANGYTTFSGSLLAGGHSQAGLNVYVAGVKLYGGPALPITVNSPDINGDLMVNIQDLVSFADDFASGQAPFRSDLFRDGTLDLKDVARFATANGVSCP